MKKGSDRPPMIYLTQDEYKIIQMALGMAIDDLKTVSQDPTKPFDVKTRQDMDIMLRAASSAGTKIQKLTGIEATVPPYNPGDENRFFTKES